MSKWKTRILALVIVAVDMATAANLYEAYAFFERPAFAASVAVAFAVLQIGTLILFATPLPTGTRRLLFLGAVILLGVTGLSNVAMGYSRSKTSFPAEELQPALGFGLDAVTLGVLAAWISGMALVIVALIFWTAFGQHMRQVSEQEQQALKELDEMLSKPLDEVRR